MDKSEFDEKFAAKEAEFRAARKMFAEALGLVMGEFDVQFPKNKGAYPPNRSGIAKLGSRVDDLMTVYDRLQASLGIPEGEEARFARAFDRRPLIMETPESPN